MTNLLTNARSQTLTKKLQWVELFDSIAENLDLTPSQVENIEQAYRSVSTWLASSDIPILQNAEIYPQGSIRLKIAVKPLGQDEFDVDLILFLPKAENSTRDEILAAVRARLNEHPTYKNLLSELPRGFRINYAGNYHLDITPGKRHESIWLPGQPLWIPDKREGLKESNAKGMAEWFDEICKLMPKRFHFGLMKAANESRDNIEELPSQHLKAPLNRIIQISKRHRDEWALRTDNPLTDYKPISVLITTLSTMAYENIIGSGKVFDNDYDIILDVIESMPRYIEIENNEYRVNNPSMPQENYAEKWNRLKDNEGELLKQAFHAWHQNAITTFESLANQSDKGMDTIFDSLSDAFGSRPVNHARETMVYRLNESRNNNRLGVVLKTGTVLPTSSAAHSRTMPIKKNTFYGSSQ